MVGYEANLRALFQMRFAMLGKININYTQITMVECSKGDTDEEIISFEIGTLINQNNIIFDEIDENNIPDELLVGLLDDVENNHATMEGKPKG